MKNQLGEHQNSISCCTACLPSLEKVCLKKMQELKTKIRLGVSLDFIFYLQRCLWVSCFPFPWTQPFKVLCHSSLEIELDCQHGCEWKHLLWVAVYMLLQWHQKFFDWARISVILVLLSSTTHKFTSFLKAWAFSFLKAECCLNMWQRTKDL